MSLIIGMLVSLSRSGSLRQIQRFSYLSKDLPWLCRLRCHKFKENAFYFVHYRSLQS
jgi:hypothetical protein